jgi:site-specific DNA-methyltransferase (adenine-specific)
MEAFAAYGERGAAAPASGRSLRGENTSVARGRFAGLPEGRSPAFHDDTGTAARFFYSAKATKADRAGSKHPTIKPLALMRWLCRLITPPGGHLVDPFAGSGTTGAAAQAEGFDATLMEREAEYLADIQRRLAA